MAAASLMMLAAGVQAAELEKAITGGQPSFDGRLRYEHAEEDNPAEDADALTFRARLGYGTATWQGFDAFAEYEGVYAIGGDGEYNSGPGVLSETNGRTGHSVIADPTGDELNRGWIRYRGFAGTEIKAGRQRIILDNARFIGNVGWRQNEQTLDALIVRNQSLQDITLTYGYLWKQNFIFFNDNELDAHLFNVGWAASGWLKLSAYGYFIDFKEENLPRVPGTPDTRTIGLRATGKHGPFSYALEYADQSGYADAPSSVDAEYWLVEAAYQTSIITPMLGYEVLGGDGSYGFSTPLATLHAFQGWADLFLNTPANGIRDAYAKLSGKLEKVALAVVYHDFQSDSGSMDYGSEIDFVAALPVTTRLSVLLKYADYSADDFAVDTERLWVQAEYKF